ncbi:OmpP1/FadL family transporter [Mucilaginibacter ginkgonis]|uniref:Outer membrane protein transport protein n=1 Tax=Mucilaginibacter ginkgonis TaxID=2682091 RepID=A0A6I4IMG0_9SPHI|nr:outer membrane protein transport protein [Mucilaginibacter ginkgonis]QQL50410.1 outer membrane protein transport protein [Mucilaginibacter ginkgonis]
MRKLLLMLLAFAPAMVLAQGFQVNVAGQKQIGMGHTGTGLVQDGASIFFNPGAVAMLPENSIQAGISPLFFKPAFQAAGSVNVAQSADKVATPFSAYAVFGPKNSWWKAGLGVYTPFGGLVDWGNNWTGKYVLESLDLKAIYFQPTVSIRLAKWISVGGGFVYNHGTVNLTRAIPLANSTGSDGQAQLKGSGHGTGFNLGVYLKPTDKFSIGVDYRSKVSTTINNGDAIFTVPASVQANFPQPNTFTATLPLAATTSVGLGYMPTSQWTIAVDANFVQWDVYKALAFDYANNTATLQDTYSPRNYKNAFSIRGGLQYAGDAKHPNTIPKELALRIGGGYASTPVQDGYVSPEVPDANRYFLTAGLGYKATRNLTVDVSFEYEHLMTRTQTTIETQLSGTYKTNVYIPGISLTYHW